MVARQTRELLKEWRVRICVGTFILIGILPLLLMGVEFGMDFKGGTRIQLELDRPVDPSTMSTITTILQERLNRFGLKDISVRPYGEQYITVEVSTNDSRSISNIKEVISSQGRFEAVIDGEIALYSEDLIKISTNPQEGYGYIQSTGSWRVPFRISKEGSERFKDLAQGKCKKIEGLTECEKIYMFIDRPEDSIIIIPAGVYNNESKMSMSPGNIRSPPLNITKFWHNTLTDYIVADQITPEILSNISNYSKVIIHPQVQGKELLQNKSFKVEEVPVPISGYWLWSATGLQSVLNLTPGVTSGNPIREAVIEGHSPDWETANEELTQMVVLLKSGSLPVSVEVGSTSIVSPTLGESFVSNILTMALVAWIAVGLIVLLRYRDIKVTVLMLGANVAEVVIILGVAALISWELDIAGVAGIIAVVGTGLDQFIIITDEVKTGGVIEESVIDKVKKAFRIIMGSAFTTVAAMVPLLTLGLGIMKGFAITTLIGLFVGVVIVRPAFAKIVEKIF